MGVRVLGEGRGVLREGEGRGGAMRVGGEG